MSKKKDKKKNFTVSEYAEELDISRQAVLKKIKNTLKGAKSNILPEGASVQRMGIYYYITIN